MLTMMKLINLPVNTEKKNGLARSYRLTSIGGMAFLYNFIGG